MNSKVLSNTDTPTEPSIKDISGLFDMHEKSLLEVMDSIPGGENIEFDPPIANIIFEPAVFD
jgi:hypothetical protein